MKFFALSFLVLFFSVKSIAQYRGCATVYEQTLCEMENNYLFSSEMINWSIEKLIFQQHLKNIISENIELEGTAVVDTYFWVNDFNTIQVIKFQVWNADKSFMVSLPAEYKDWDKEGKLSMRHMGDLPYPLDFGYHLEELILLCSGECGQEQIDFLNSISEVHEVFNLNKETLLVKVGKWQEKQVLNKIKNLKEFHSLFQSVHLNHIVEANGFSEFAFRFNLYF